jgi:hypothetical protein
MAKTFILSDDSLNSKGFRIMTAGIDIEQFKANPVMLFMHNRPFYKDSSSVIGRWENIRKEKGQLLADAVFDMDDPFAASIAKKVENNFLRMASLGARPVETSSDPKDLLPGQCFETVTRCIAREASIVDIGANDSALCLFDVPALYNDQEKLVELAAGSESIIPTIKITSDMKFTDIELAEVAPLLGLSDTATSKDVIGAVQKLKTDKEAAEAKLADQEKTQQAEKIATLVDGAVEAKKITAAQKDNFIKLATGDFESTKAILDSMTPYVSLKDSLAAGGASSEAEELVKMSANDLWKSGKLETLREKNFEVFKQKYRELNGTDFRGDK